MVFGTRQSEWNISYRHIKYSLHTAPSNVNSSVMQGTVTAFDLMFINKKLECERQLQYYKEHLYQPWLFLSVLINMIFLLAGDHMW